MTGETKGMITIEAGVLARAMKHAAGIVESSQTIPILANARLSASGDTLQVTTSDLDTELRQDLPLAVPGELATTVDARRLSMLASAVEAGSQIEIRLDGGRMTVRSGRSRWVLPVLPADDFPSMTFSDDAVELQIDGGELARAIERVLWSVETNASRYYLTGPLLHAEEGKAALVATNGHTLARVVSDADFPEGGTDAILGPKFSRILGTLCADAGPISLAWDAAKIQVTAGQIRLTGKLIDGTYPDYRRIIPTRDAEPIIIDPANFRAALRRVLLVSMEKTRGVKFLREDDKVTLSVTAPDSGAATEEIPASCKSGFETGFNAQQLDRAIEAMGGDTIRLFQVDDRAPTLIERTVPDGMLCVVDAMRV